MKVTDVKLESLGHNIALFMCQVHVEQREYPIQFMIGEDDYTEEIEQKLIDAATNVAIGRHNERTQ